MSNFDIVKKALIDEINKGFRNNLNLIEQAILSSAKKNIIKQVILTLKGAELANGDFKTKYNPINYSEDYISKVRADRRKDFGLIKKQATNPAKCHMYVCKLDDMIYKTSGDPVVFNGVTEIYLKTIPCLKKLLNTGGSSFQELVLNSYNNLKEAREIIDYQIVSRKELADYIKKNKLMSRTELVFVNKIVKAIKIGLEGLIQNCYK